jgi:hypothetical protein
MKTEVSACITTANTLLAKEAHITYPVLKGKWIDSIFLGGSSTEI